MSVFSAFTLAFAAPAAVQSHCAPVATTIRGSAPLIVGPLVPLWATAFAKREPSIQLDLGPPYGPPQGVLDTKLAAFLDGRSDFAFLTREIAEADLVRFKQAHGTAPLVIPIANGSAGRFGYVDPVVFIVNARNPLRTLSFAQIDALFSTTRVRGGKAVIDWGVLNGPAWRGKAVHLAGGGGWAGEESARALTVRRQMLTVGQRSGQWRPSPGGGGEADVVARVAADPLAIGFTGLGHITPGVRVVPITIDGHSAAIMPTRDAVIAGAYPLTRTVDLLLVPGKDGLPAPALRHWVHFLISPAGQAALGIEGNFLPLRPGQIAQARRLAGPVTECR